jgi:hypothetical protein
MNEDEFWRLLRFQINCCVPGLLDPRIGYCDWFEPKHYFLDGRSPRITGHVGFVCVRGVSDLAFTLFLGRSVDSLEEIQWEFLLPPDGSTGWLLDHGNQIEINPKWATKPPAPNPD